MPSINPWALIGGVIWSVLCFAAGWQVADKFIKVKELEKRVDAMIAREELRGFYDTMATDLELQLEGLRSMEPAITLSLEKEIAQNPVYSNCVLPDNGLLILNSY